MRILSTRLLTLALIIGGGGFAAQAQEGLRGPGGAIGGFHLITMPAIQRELQLDDRQVARAREVASRMNARFQQDIGKLQGLNQDEKMKRVLSLAGPHYEEGMRQLRAFLKPAQLERYDQILFQQRGPMAMLEPKIAQTLQITNEQAEKVAKLVSQAEKRPAGRLEGGRARHQGRRDQGRGDRRRGERESFRDPQARTAADLESDRRQAVPPRLRHQQRSGRLGTDQARRPAVSELPGPDHEPSQPKTRPRIDRRFVAGTGGSSSTPVRGGLVGGATTGAST